VSSHIDCVAGDVQYSKNDNLLHFYIGLKARSMKSGIGRWSVVVLLSSLVSGCSSIRARTETPDKEWTVYPGIQRDVKDTDGLFSGKSSDPAWAKGMIATMLVVDLPFSAVFDTIVAPYDLYRIYAPKDTDERKTGHRDYP
jgi:uncharacterized protein YceK